METKLKIVSNPPNRYDPKFIEWIDAPPPVAMQVFEEEAKSIISTNKSPDIGFTHSINPYSGCFHGCAYCYARPGHQYIGFGAGTDFESKLVVKVNAPQKLRQELQKRSWKRELIVFSGVTDCYQPLEASYELTRRCLIVLSEYKNPIHIITKGALVRRDIDILTSFKSNSPHGVKIGVTMSIAFSDDRLAKQIEPGAPRPSVRFRAMQELSKAGIPVGVGIAPIIPGLNDQQIPEILERTRDAGGTSAFMNLLRLPAEVKDVFVERIGQALPTQKDKILNRIKEIKGGVLNRSKFGTRFRGDGPRWEAIQWLFKNTCEKLKLNSGEGDDMEKQSIIEKPVRVSNSNAKQSEKQLSLY